MIVVSPGVRVYLACGITDMRNYAERRLMRSPSGGGMFFPFRMRDLARPSG